VRPYDPHLWGRQKPRCRSQAGHQIPQYRREPTPSHRRHRRRKHELRRRLLSRGPESRRQMSSAPHVPSRTPGNPGGRLSDESKIAQTVREPAEDRKVEDISREETDMDYHALNAMLNRYDESVRIQFERDQQAARQYLLQHVNDSSVFVHDLKEKL